MGRPTQRPVHPRPVVGGEERSAAARRGVFLAHLFHVKLQPVILKPRTAAAVACLPQSIGLLLPPSRVPSRLARPGGRGTLWHCCNVWELPFGPPSPHCPPPSFIFSFSSSSASLPQGKAKLRPSLPPSMSPIEFCLAAAASAAHEKCVVAAHKHMAISCRILHFPFSAKWRCAGRGGGDLSVNNGLDCCCCSHRPRPSIHPA